MKARRQAAFTLVELMVAAAVASGVGIVLFTLLNTTTLLYASNVSINQTHFAERRSIDRILAKVESAAGAPQLVNDTGATIPGNGPAAGIRSLVPATPLPYQVTADVGATSSALVAIVGTRPVPGPGDVILMPDLGFHGTVASSTVSGGTYTVNLTSTAGNCFSPVRPSGTVIPANSKFFLYSPTAYIAVENRLRYYPRALSVASDGAAAFGNEANFQILATLVPVGAATNSYPFQYLGGNRRSVDITLRVSAPVFANRTSAFNNFVTVHSTAAFRSTSMLIPGY